MIESFDESRGLIDDYGYNFLQYAGDNTPWTRDIQRLMKAVDVVDNNSATSIGGGGKPRQPLAPPLAAPQESKILIFRKEYRFKADTPFLHHTSCQLLKLIRFI